MSVPDPFNPWPGPQPGEERYERRHGVDPRDAGGNSFLWVPAVIVGGIAALVLVAAL